MLPDVEGCLMMKRLAIHPSRVLGQDTVWWWSEEPLLLMLRKSLYQSNALLS